MSFCSFAETEGRSKALNFINSWDSTSRTLSLTTVFNSFLEIALVLDKLNYPPFNVVNYIHLAQLFLFAKIWSFTKSCVTYFLLFRWSNGVNFVGKN